MKTLVTGSSGHLGEALVRTLRDLGRDVMGLDLRPGLTTTHVGSITDRSFVARCLSGIQQVFHPATLHKPHVATQNRQDFVDTNITGTLHLLEEAVAAGVNAFVYTSTTSVFGDALVPPPGGPTVWVTEELRPIPKNIYGVTKAAAEDLCQLFQRNHGLSCVVLRTSRFFPEEDDDPAARNSYADDNRKVNEYLNRRVDLEDIVSAHLLAADHAAALGFRRFIVSATPPFSPDDLPELRLDAAAAVRRHVPDYELVYARRGWRMVPSLDRVYVNELARQNLGWEPKHDFRSVIARLKAGEDFRSPLARAVGSKRYHAEA